VNIFRLDILFALIYAIFMTLSRHTFLLKLGITIAATVLGGIALIAARILPAYPELVAAAVKRPGITFITDHLPPPIPYLAFITMTIAVCYALIALILLFYFFEKTQSVEAHFFIFFVFSFVFEIFRAALPLQNTLGIPSVYLSLGAHTLVFCRYFGVFSLFCASLYSAGFKAEKEENLIVPLCIITLFIAFRLPVNAYTWDTSLCIVSDYPSTFKMLEIAVIVLTVLSFLSGAYRRGIKEYYAIAAGSFLVLSGRQFLITGDTYLLPILGVIFLASGTYTICIYLRKIYLWA
jgi:hypothetical protein